MNLFILDENPYTAANLQNNKHIVKMPTETANMLLWVFKYRGLILPNTKEGKAIKLSHENHPSTKWIRHSYENFNWALNHLSALCAEYSNRYNRTHFSENYLDFCVENIEKTKFENKGFTPFARCFGDFACVIKEDNIVSAYQKFYVLDKYDSAKWPSVEKIPAFWPEKTEKFVDNTFKNGIYTKR